jgi:hypothetical protein
MRSLDNRRAQPRRSSGGLVILNLEKPLSPEVVGSLVDLSLGGFRVRYESAQLERGDRVQFRHKAGTGSAVVIWTRILGSTLEAGFQVTR